MAVDERSRHELHKRLEEVLDPDTAATLMAHLPPGGWSNLATKQDLLELRSDLKSFTLWTVLATNLTLVIAVVGIAFGAARLA